MKKSAFSEEPITYTVRQVELRTPVAEVCRQLGMSDQTFYRWKRRFAGMGVAELRRFAGMGVAELRRLRLLEEENGKPKRLVADVTLDKHMLQEVLRKKL